MKFIVKDTEVWVKLESMDDVRLVLIAQEIKRESASKAPAKTLVRRPRHYKTPCPQCGKKVKGLKMHIRKAHTSAPTLPSWMNTSS